MYRRFLRQIRAHPRHRVKTALLEEVRLEFSTPVVVAPSSPPSSSSSDDAGGGGGGGGDGGDEERARLLARSLLALTWLKRAAADPLSSEGELLYTLVGQRDGLLKRQLTDDKKPGVRERRLKNSSSTVEAQERLWGELYEPLTDIIGVRGIAGEHWRPPRR